jgi:protein-L-isoaspartate(D-aspartate) O-methyltransferase
MSDTTQYKWDEKRKAMVAILQHHYGIRDVRVLKAMEKVRRHVFIPLEHCQGLDPYGDYPCPIGYGQTISQPYIVAYMTERLNLKEGENVLEVGTGCGYQSAILAELGAKVLSIEIIPELAEHSKKILEQEGYSDKVTVVTADAYRYPYDRKFDAIICTCAPPNIPSVLVEQMNDPGRMILPVGVWEQYLVFITKEKGKIREEKDIAVRFVPMVQK